MNEVFSEYKSLHIHTHIEISDLCTCYRAKVFTLPGGLVADTREPSDEKGLSHMPRPPSPCLDEPYYLLRAEPNLVGQFLQAHG